MGAYVQSENIARGFCCTHYWEVLDDDHQRSFKVKTEFVIPSCNLFDGLDRHVEVRLSGQVNCTNDLHVRLIPDSDYGTVFEEPVQSACPDIMHSVQSLAIEKAFRT